MFQLLPARLCTEVEQVLCSLCIVIILCMCVSISPSVRKIAHECFHGCRQNVVVIGMG